MSLALKLTLALLAGFVPVGYVFYQASLSPDDWVYQGGSNWKDGGVHAAPGPEMGAGLPVVLIAGAAYLVYRRSRRKTTA